MKLRSSLNQCIFRSVGAALLAISTVSPAVAQDNASRQKGMPDDWSHHHLVFSNPGTFQDAMKNGTYDRWMRIVTDPRFHQQQLKRKATQWQATAVGVGGDLDISQPDANGLPTNYAFAGGIIQDPLPHPLRRDWSMDLGSNGSVGAGQYPAKFSFQINQAACDSASQPDFVVYNTNLAGAGSQPSIIAYDNLYSGCGGTYPLVYFQYNTNGGSIPTSVVLAEDGIQMAFVQNNSSGNGTVGSLVILKTQRNTIGQSAGLVTLSNTDPSLYRACTAPCMTAFTLNVTVTYSAPFYDYANDVLYVGDDSGELHKFQNVFASGTPSEITGGDSNSGWPQNISSVVEAEDPLTAPVYDSGSGNVFVGITTVDDTNGAELAYIPATGGYNNIVVSAQLADPAGYGLVDSPLVDSTAATVYSFVDTDFSGAENAAVFQQATNFLWGDSGTEQTLGVGDIFFPQIAYDGMFDNTYFSSPDPSNPSGNLYVCGRDANRTFIPTLYQVPISNNVVGAPVTGPALATTGNSIPASCSPVAEFFNSPTDWLFLSVTADNKTGSPISCPAGTGCVMSFNVTSASGFSPSKDTAAAVLAASGSSGFVVDNSLSSPSGTSQIYFSTLGNQTCAGNGSTGNGTGSCAIQASQAALQ